MSHIQLREMNSLWYLDNLERRILHSHVVPFHLSPTYASELPA